MILGRLKVLENISKESPNIEDSIVKITSLAQNEVSKTLNAELESIV